MWRRMTDARTPPTESLDETFGELVEDFDLLGDWEQRIEYVIELGKGLAPLADADRIEANKVPGCAAQVWLATDAGEGRLWFAADSDSALSKGNIALLLKLYSGRTPAEISGLRRQGGAGASGPSLRPDPPARQRSEQHGRADQRGGPGRKRSGGIEPFLREISGVATGAWS